VHVATSAPRPFLKWAGGKAQLLDQLAPLFPAKFGRYFEPFLGGGAVFFSFRPERARLTDVNSELIACYRAVRDEPSAVVTALSAHHYDKDHFYEVREQNPEQLTSAERAARTIFLNKAAFNGLYRVNSRGLFNVPFGRHRNPTICDPGNLAACSAALQIAELEVADFSSVLAHARAGDFVYFDPPYAPVSDTADFTAYAAGGFTWARQEQLAATFRELGARGVRAALSNSDVPALRQLYADQRIETVAALRRINSNAGRRGKLSEIVVLNY